MMLQLKRFWPLPIGVVAALAIWAGCQTGHMAPPPPVVTLPTDSLKPGPDDAKTAYYVARLMEEFQYLQHPLDKQMSAKFFDGYIDSLDPRHEYFLQSDLAEFAPYRTNLDTLTINRSMSADLSPAFLIYHRYQERFQQRTAYANELLNEEKFKFNSDDKIENDRRHEPFPKDLAEAEKLWRESLRYEYLTEKLAREVSESNGVVSVKLPADAHTNILAELEKHYRWNLHLMTNEDSDAVLLAYLNALTHAYDPHSDYFSGSRAQDFSISMNLSLFGIGAQLTEDNGYCTIHSLVAGGPASKSKLINEKDRIIAVAQGNQEPVDVVDMDLEKVVQQIRGPKGTEVRLVLSQAPDFTSRKTVSLVRDEIKLEDAAAKAKIIEMPDDHGGTNRLGILELPSFYAPVEGGPATPRYASADAAVLLKKLKAENVSGVIVDMRSNPGGSLEEAIKFTGLFIKDGPVVQARNPDGQTAVESDTDFGPGHEQLYAGPLLVMVNRFSASASEIAAAALQDYGRAVIVGDVSTHGKGTVQSLNQLKPFILNSTNDPGELKITIRKFYRISGASTQLKGVSPDIILPDKDLFNYSTQIGESNLDNPLAWDTIQPAAYDKMNLVAPYLADLRELSDARVLTNQDFSYVRQDIEQFKKLQVDRTTSLNEHQIIKDRERDAAKNHMREEERDKRPDPGIRVYELTVENAAEPGLPPPENWLGMTNDPAVAVAIKNIASELDHTPAVPAPGAKVTGIESNTATQAKKPSPPFDPMLDESERILEDYISLMQKRGNLTSIP